LRSRSSRGLFLPEPQCCFHGGSLAWQRPEDMPFAEGQSDLRAKEGMDEPVTRAHSSQAAKGKLSSKSHCVPLSHPCAPRDHASHTGLDSGNSGG
jgi:hypothetical protein